MIKKLYITIFLFLSFMLNVSAEIVKKIEVNGNKRVSAETIKIYGKIKLNENYTEKDINEVLQNLNSTNFFQDININLSNNTLIINVKEYPTVNQLILLGEKSNNIKEQISKLISTKKKRPFISSLLKKDVEIIKSLYSSIGYNFAKISTRVKNIDENNLDIIFDIERGNKTVISSINFIGDKKIREKKLKSIIASEEHKFWKVISKNSNFSRDLISLDKRLLTNYYRSIGFKDVEVTSSFVNLSDKGNMELTYSIEAGTRYRINKISTKVDNVFDKQLFSPLNKIYKDIAGEYYSPFKIKDILDEVELIVEKNNLQFVEQSVSEKKEGNNINLIFNIYEGEKFLVERINILGNNITDEAVIRGELTIDEGDPFTDLAIQKSVAEIQQRNIFKNVNYEVLNSSENKKIVNITVEEKPTGEISAGAGIGTSGSTFAINIQENNWLGEGKNVGLDLEVTSESIIGTFSYNNPNYDFLGNSIYYAASSQKNDKPSLGYENTVQSFDISTTFEQYKDTFTSLGLHASYDDLRTDDTASDNLKKQHGSFVDLSGKYGVRRDNRDRVFNPTKGSVISFGQSLPLTADKPYIQNTLNGSFYKSFSDDIVGSTKIFISSIDGLDNEDVRLSKRIGLSSRKLRGFERNKIGPKDGDDYVGGNYAAALNFETNLPNLLPDKSNVDVSLFLDFGNVWGVDYDSSLDDSNKIRSSTGLGASWLSPIGPMTFTLSQNLSKASTDVTESFNFNLGTTF
tara:strand:- start:4476 stop:6707 length:2232 start_codon:yes stop_codon:yes gene_type:complete